MSEIVSADHARRTMRMPRVARGLAGWHGAQRDEHGALIMDHETTEKVELVTPEFTVTRALGRKPNQVWGTRNGQAWYFWARGQRWKLWLMHPEDALDTIETGREVASGEARNAGWWEWPEHRPFVEALVKITL